MELPYYHAMNGKTHVPGRALADKLLSIAPVPMAKVHFASSGSEANDTALKLISYYHNAIGKPEKKKVIGRVRGYHGTSFTTSSLSGQAAMYPGFDLPFSHHIHVEEAHHWRHARAGESEVELSARLAQSLERRILAEGPETVAAFFAEPVHGAGGVLVPPEGYFEAVQAILRKYDILFVVDEVITGFGRTGETWGAQTYNLKPDLLTSAKALTAAFAPLSALLVNERVYDAVAEQAKQFGVFAHGYTYSPHPVSCAVALETIRIYEEDDIVGHVRSEAGPALQSGLRALAEHPLVGETCGVGLIGGIQLVLDKGAKRLYPAEARAGPRLLELCQERGLIIRSIAGDRIGLAPPLIISAEEVSDLLARLSSGLDALYGELAPFRKA